MSNLSSEPTHIRGQDITGAAARMQLQIAQHDVAEESDLPVSLNQRNFNFPALSSSGYENSMSSRNSGSSVRRGDCFDEQFYKTQLCWYWQRGCCTRQVCRFAHGEAELRRAPDLTRTAMCRSVIQGRKCQDPTCEYAHRLCEVRATNSYYKTAMCEFFRSGFCKLRQSCRYAHSADELRPRTKEDELLSHCDFASSQFSRMVTASTQFSREVTPSSEFSRQVTSSSQFSRAVSSTDGFDVQGSSAVVTVRQPAPIEWQDELGSKQPRDCAQPNACTTEQGLAMKAMQSHGVASPQTCRLSDRSAFLSNSSAHSPRVDVAQHRQKYGLQQQQQKQQQQQQQQQQHASHLQEPSHRLSPVDGRYTGAVGSNTCRQGLLVSKMCARRQPDTRGGLLESGVRTLTPSEFSNVPMVQALDPAASVARPGVDAGEAFESMRPGNNIMDLGRDVESHNIAESQLPPVREPFNSSAATASGSPLAIEALPYSNARSCDPAEALLREMQARMLKAAMPEHYED